MKRSGVADLPLHGGRVPAWLATRMVTLGTAIAESVLHHYGRSALLSRLSDPVLVPGARLGDGHGLAFLRHHDVGDGRAEEGTQPDAPTSSASTSAAAAAGTRATRLTNCARRRSHEPRRRRAGSHQPTDRPHRQQRRRRRLSDLSALVRPDRRRRVGHRAAGNERSEPARPAAITGTRRRSATSPPIRTRRSSVSTPARS